jgi:Holliday junction resolvase YEN1
VKNADGRDDGNHVVTYSAIDIGSHDDIRLSRGGCILIGLLSGGDYHEAGVQGCGKLIAAGLARCGLGDRLLEATSSLDREELEDWLVTWRDQLREELRTNKSGFIGSKKPALAKKIPDDFPDLDILLSYTNPITSETEGKPTREVTWEQEPDIGKIAGLCELYFEWGVKDVIIKRFRTVLWPSAVLRILRRGAMEKDEKRRKGLPTSPQKSKTTGKLAPGTPSKMITKYFSSMKLNSPTKTNGREREHSDTESEAEEDRLIVKIHSSRRHASTDGILEYRVEIAPAQLVRLAEDGVQGIRPPVEVDAAYEDTEGEDEDEDRGKHKSKGKKPPPDPESHLRVWMPACMVKTVEPELVEAFEETQLKKLEKKVKRSNKSEGKKKGVPTVQEDSDGDALPVLNRPKKKIIHSKKAVGKEHDSGPAPHPFPLSPTGPRNPVRASTSHLSRVALKKHTKPSDSDSSEPHISGSPRKSPPPIRPIYESDDTTSKAQGKKKGVFTARGDNDEDVLPKRKPVRQKKSVEQQQLVPRPFPMSNFLSPSEDPFIDPEHPVRAPSPQQSFQTASKRFTKSSGSEYNQSRVTKSPRKSPQQTSPRSDLIKRPGSPVPIQPIHKFDEVIDISSDSDVPLPPAKLHVKAPLLLAREKAKKGAIESTRPVLELTSRGTSKRAVVIEDDIIDLT